MLYTRVLPASHASVYIFNFFRKSVPDIPHSVHPPVCVLRVYVHVYYHRTPCVLHMTCAHVHVGSHVENMLS